LAGVGGGPALLVESFEAVQEDVQAEFELELVVAAAATSRVCVVGPGRGDLDDVGVRRGQLAEQGRPLVGLCGWWWCGEDLEGESPHSAAEGVHHVVGEIGGESAGPKQVREARAVPLPADHVVGRYTRGRPRGKAAAVSPLGCLDPSHRSRRDRTSRLHPYARR